MRRGWGRRSTRRIGLVGTGFVARGYARLLQQTPGVRLTRVLTRRRPEQVDGIPRELLTNSTLELIDSADVVVLSTGDPVYGTDVLSDVVEAGRPVITMDSELQVTTGSYFVDKAWVSEADGDQPGCQARLKEQAERMGFTPLAYVNIKGFLNLDPSPKDMAYWAERQGIRLEQVVSFTDGTKLQIEQALVANGLGTTLIQDGMVGGTVEDIHDTDYLADRADELRCPVSDYVLSPKAPPGVFILARNEMAEALPHYGPFARVKTTQGRYYLLLRPYHLCHLELASTLRQLMEGGSPILNNSSRPRFGVAAIAKRDLPKGTRIARALGSFDLRGHAVGIEDHPEHVPIGILTDAVTTQRIELGQPVGFDDVELPETRALRIWQTLRDRALADRRSITTPA